MVLQGKQGLWVAGGFAASLAVIAAISFSPVCAGRPAVAGRDMEPGPGPDARLAATARRASVRDQIITDLLAGRVGLLEAAARFRDLNSEDEITWPALRLVFREASDDEACCRQVIAWVRVRLAHQPDEGRPVLDRLEAELAECLRYGLTLPAPDGP
ncbi:MAG TPA: hypothetical protein VFA26_24545 [Gemmataceae bacterium]|nr:hypothetical protein [Gemmataceae bacterium]